MATTIRSRAFVRYAVLSGSLVWSLYSCTGKVIGSEANASTKAGADAREDRGGVSKVDAGMSPTSSAGRSANSANSGGTGGEARSRTSGGADAKLIPDAGTPASEPDPAKTPAQNPVATLDDGEDAGLSCEPLRTPRPVSYPKCSEALCPGQDSVCVPGSAVQALGVPFGTATSLSECSDGSKCVSTAIVEQAGHVRLPHCTSVAGAEGRCVSSCMPMGAWQPSDLPQDTCAASEHCAPCYDPSDGRATGACALGCDRGPEEAPRTLETCCSGRGRCMPPQTTGSANLKPPRDSCESDAVCVPSSLTDARAIPKTCASVDGSEGRCTSTCLGRLTALIDLPTQGCAKDEVCTPCYDPITGNNTGACTLHGDAPTQPMQRFERCCDGDREIPAGVCVPPKLSRGRAGDIFRRSPCKGDRVCVPTVELVDPDYQYPLCLSVTLGVCMPSCLFDPLDALLFTSLLCDRGDVCVPCSPLIGGCN
jgi:hypothetical protein